MNKFIKLNKIANIITGFPFKGELYSNIGIRTVRGENVTEGNLRWDTIKCWNQEFDKKDYYLLRSNDVVIGMDGSKVGKNKARIKSDDLPLLLAQRVACVRVKPNNDQIFLYYLINNPRFENYVFKTQTGSSVPHISKTQIEEYEVPDLNLPTQQKIASVLSALDDKIELNIKINAELEAMAKTLYDYWFVQFDFPNAEGKPYKSSGGEMVFDEVLKREIPKGWEVKSLGEIANIIAGGDKPLTISKEKTDDYSIPIYSNGIQNDGLYGYTKQARIFKQSITISARGTIGFCLLRNETFVPIIRLISVTPAENTAIYYFYTIKNLVFENSGSVQQQLTVPQVSSINVIEPSKYVLQNFDNISSTFNEKSENIKKQNQELASLRDWLLPMLMNGQVTVSGAYKEVEQTLRRAQDETLAMVAEGETEYIKQ